ncbi:hypothetical protein LFL96_07425 [Paraburkholderia sp. D15]|uniref:hypothetical protein n=1 Tax=Paraburkholderia sp. D15 TaxID=2880218 RepID=UPI0024783C0C|nr:hypothetical protein [Paraburkholderia sp. D15]WGS51325.1 hypothetical protein LFL96_07425 [Paraburkholderia sp. D15]
MSKTPKKTRTASRAAVDGDQYERLALSAFRMIERQMTQLDNLLTLATSIYQNPATTMDERARQRTLLGLWIETGEAYRREVEIDRELYGIVALDARGVPQSQLSARYATKLLAKAAETSMAGEEGALPNSMAACASDAKTLTRRTAVAH